MNTRNVTPLPSNPRLSPNAGARDHERRVAERDSFDCVSHILAEALEKCDVQLRGMDDCEILNALQALKCRAALKAGE